MPGPVSDSFDPEFSTAANAQDVREMIGHVRDRVVGRRLAPHLKDIVDVVHGQPGDTFKIVLTERDLRIIRFAMNRALASI
jgi:hypothetical protein